MSMLSIFFIQPSERMPLNTGWRIVPLSVSCIKCAVPTSSGFIQTIFLYCGNHGLCTLLPTANSCTTFLSSFDTPRYTLPRFLSFPFPSKYPSTRSFTFPSSSDWYPHIKRSSSYITLILIQSRVRLPIWYNPSFFFATMPSKFCSFVNRKKSVPRPSI